MRRRWRGFLAGIAGFQLIAAVVGMVGLTVGGGLGLPAEWLRGTPFPSYVWPGIMLGTVVGGAQALALVVQLRRPGVGWAAHAVAGVVMMTWIFVEVAMILEWAPLQGVFFTCGAVQTVTAVLTAPTPEAPEAPEAPEFKGSRGR